MKDISLDIAENDIVALLGLNGTGKSSLLRTISGLQKQKEGSISIKNKSLNAYSDAELSRQLGIVLSGRGEMMQSLTVIEILSMARSPYTGFMHVLSDNDKKIIKDIIDQLGAEHLLYRPIYQLSDGEMQKIMIAKVLVQQTPLILLDEPTSHLDIVNKVEIFSLIRQLKKQNKTVLFASHELEMALQIADKCILLDHSGAFVFGATQTLIDTHQFQHFFNAKNFYFNETLKKFESNLL